MTEFWVYKWRYGHPHPVGRAAIVDAGVQLDVEELRLLRPLEDAVQQPARLWQRRPEGGHALVAPPSDGEALRARLKARLKRPYFVSTTPGAFLPLATQTLPASVLKEAPAHAQ